MSQSNRPNIFEYDDFRGFLKDFTDYLRTQNKFSVRKFSEQVGFKSSGFLNLIMSGKRKLSEDNMTKVGLALELRRNEFHYFESLVRFNQANDTIEKGRLYEELMKFKGFHQSRKLSQEQYKYLSNWYMVVLLQALKYKSFSALSPAKMSKIIGVSERKILDGLETLEKLGFIKRTAFRWKALEAIVEMPKQLTDVNFSKFHHDMIDKALRSLEIDSEEKRMFSTMTLTLTNKQIYELQTRFFEFVLKMSTQFEDEEDDPDAVYQVNIQCFPLIKFLNDPEEN